MPGIDTAVQAASVIATTVASINDMNKRRNIESNLMLMSEKQKIALANQIAGKQNSLDKANLLMDAVISVRNAAADRAQRANTVKWILIGAAGVAVLGIVAWYLKK